MPWELGKGYCIWYGAWARAGLPEFGVRPRNLWDVWPWVSYLMYLWLGFLCGKWGYSGPCLRILLRISKLTCVRLSEPCCACNNCYKVFAAVLIIIIIISLTLKLTFGRTNLTSFTAWDWFLLCVDRESDLMQLLFSWKSQVITIHFWHMLVGLYSGPLIFRYIKNAVCMQPFNNPFTLKMNTC